LQRRSKNITSLPVTPYYVGGADIAITLLRCVCVCVCVRTRARARARVCMLAR